MIIVIIKKLEEMITKIELPEANKEEPDTIVTEVETN